MRFLSSGETQFSTRRHYIKSSRYKHTNSLAKHREAAVAFFGLPGSKSLASQKSPQAAQTSSHGANPMCPLKRRVPRVSHRFSPSNTNESMFILLCIVESFALANNLHAAKKSRHLYCFFTKALAVGRILCYPISTQTTKSTKKICSTLHSPSCFEQGINQLKSSVYSVSSRI